MRHAVSYAAAGIVVALVLSASALALVGMQIESQDAYPAVSTTTQTATQTTTLVETSTVTSTLIPSSTTTTQTAVSAKAATTTVTQTTTSTSFSVSVVTFTSVSTTTSTSEFTLVSTVVSTSTTTISSAATQAAGPVSATVVALRAADFLATGTTTSLACGPSASGSYITLSNSAATGANVTGVSLTWAGATADLTLSGSCVLGAAGSPTATLNLLFPDTTKLPVSAVAGQAFSGTVTLSGGAQALFTGTFQ